MISDKTEKFIGDVADEIIDAAINSKDPKVALNGAIGFYLRQLASVVTEIIYTRIDLDNSSDGHAPS